MSLSEAVDILKKEKGVCDLEISNGHGNQKYENFSQAVEVVTEYIDKFVSLIMRI